MLSPNPGVSTTVSAIRIPSSSSSGRCIQEILVEGLVLWFKNWPTLAGFILIPASIWASSGLSMTLCARTSDSHSVFTKVVRPVPEAPSEIGSTLLWTDSINHLTRTDNHDGELDALHFVSPSSWDRHIQRHKFTIDLTNLKGMKVEHEHFWVFRVLIDFVNRLLWWQQRLDHIYNNRAFWF